MFLCDGALSLGLRALSLPRDPRGTRGRRRSSPVVCVCHALVRLDPFSRARVSFARVPLPWSSRVVNPACASGRLHLPDFPPRRLWADVDRCLVLPVDVSALCRSLSRGEGFPEVRPPFPYVRWVPRLGVRSAVVSCRRGRPPRLRSLEAFFSVAPSRPSHCLTRLVSCRVTVE